MMRLRHVAKRWKTPPPLIASLSTSSSPAALTTSVMWVSSVRFPSILPNVKINARKPTTRIPTTPNKRPICDMGIRPMNIIRKMTAQSRAAVDRFSMPMRKAVGNNTARIYPNALRSAPFSRCIALRICAVTKTIVPLAISDGWKVKPISEMTRLAPLILSPPMSTHSRVMTVMIIRKGVISLKYRQGMFKVTTATSAPATIVAVW